MDEMGFLKVLYQDHTDHIFAAIVNYATNTPGRNTGKIVFIH